MKLSTALRKGNKICKENGIRQARNEFYRQNKGEICAACALTQAFIGVVGLKKANQHARNGGRILTTLEKKFPQLKTRDHNECLKKNVSKKVAENSISTGFFGQLSANIMSLNDTSQKSVEQIADVLDACKL